MPVTSTKDVVNTDSYSYVCSAEGCSYSKRDMCGIVLHMRTHFVYETAESSMKTATFLFKNGTYRCLDCNRRTDSRISFREHVRHHILEFPYRCCYCMAAIRSIPDLRIHSSSEHPKTPLQLSFEETDGKMNTIMASLGPEKQTFTFSTEHQQDVLMEGLNEAEVSDVSRNEQSNTCTVVQRSEKQTAKSVAKDAFTRLTYNRQLKESIYFKVPGKFLFSEGKFLCLTCSPWETESELTFKKHAWKHLHGPSGVCHRIDCQSAECPFVFGLTTLLRNTNNQKTSNVAESDMAERQGSSLMPSSNLTVPGAIFEKPVSLGNSGTQSKLTSFGSEKESTAEKEPQSSLDVSTNASRIEVDLPAENCLRKVPENSAPVDPVATKFSSKDFVKQLRFSEVHLSHLRSKAGMHFVCNSVIGEATSCQGESVHQDVSCDNTDNQTKCSDMNDSQSLGSVCSSNVADQHDLSLQDRLGKPGNNSVEHCEFVHDSTPLSALCDKCSYTCNSSVQLKWHQESCHQKTSEKKKDFCCSECGFSDHSKKTLIWHMAHHLNHHTLKFFVCIYCDRHFTHASRIKKHMCCNHPNETSNFKTETANVDYMDGIFKCPSCRAGFAWGTLLFRHLESQHKLKNLSNYLSREYDKNVCPEVIRFPKKLLQNSEEDNLLTENEVYYCGQCDFHAKTSTEYTNHCDGHLPGLDKNADTFASRYIKSASTISVGVQQKKEHVGLQSCQKPAEPVSFQCDKMAAERSVPQTNKDTVSSHSKNSTVSPRISETKSKIFGKATNMDIGDKDQILVKGKLKKSNQNSEKSAQTGLIYRSSKGWIKTYHSPMANKPSSVTVLPTNVPTLPRNLENSTTSDFERSLPHTSIFAEPIKCPKCYYTDRVRLNLIRHYNRHFTDNGQPLEMGEVNANFEKGLTFSLWQPNNLANMKVLASESAKITANVVSIGAAESVCESQSDGEKTFVAVSKAPQSSTPTTKTSSKKKKVPTATLR